MRFIIKDDQNHALAEVDVTEDTATIVIERADQPELQIIGADLHPDGTVTVGHWPDGEEWEAVIRTTGVPYPRDDQPDTPPPPRRGLPAWCAYGP